LTQPDSVIGRLFRSISRKGGIAGLGSMQLALMRVRWALEPMRQRPNQWRITPMQEISVWERELYNHIVGHIENEKGILQAYERLASDTDSPAFSYLARLILDDERRHHQMLRDLAETISTTASLSGAPIPIPDLGTLPADREKILSQTKFLLAAEEEDNRNLKRLAKELRDVQDTTMWQLIVRLIAHDNDKHRLILRFIRDRASQEVV